MNIEAYSRKTTELFGIRIPGSFTIIRGHEFRGRTFKHWSEYRGDFYRLMKFCCEFPEMNDDGDSPNLGKFKEYIIDTRDVSWVGGTYQALCEPLTDFSLYRDKLTKISSSKTYKNMVYAFDEAMVRRRVRSDYDGEYDLDKKWDSNPFHQRQPKKSCTRIVKLYVDAGFSCGVSAETIDEYGAFIAAFINIMERNSVLVEVHACYTGVGQHTGMWCQGEEEGFDFDILVKRADQYLPPGQLLKAFSTVFYRRTIFSLITASAEHMGKKVSDGLGSPFEFGKCWELDGNNLRIFSVPSHKEQGQILDQLMNIIGNKGDNETI